MKDAVETDPIPELGLIYYPDSRPGIARLRRGKGFSYVDAKGNRVTDDRVRARILTLAVPPAWEKVWICPKANGHLQATGFDTRGRKQYRYHAGWTEFRAQLKFDHLPDFGRLLPRIRRRVSRDLEADPGTQRFALAALVALIDRLGLRIGNRDYLDENGSYGATTLKRKQMRLMRDRIVLRYRAKGGKRVQQTLRNPRLHRVFSEIDDLPGADLFTWVDAAGEPHPLRSEQVNAYLGEISGDAVHTAKTFRTWLGTLHAFRAAMECGDGRLTVKAMAHAAAEHLANTPTIARNSYIHPRVLSLAEAECDERQARIAAARQCRVTGLNAGESALCGFLEG